MVGASECLGVRAMVVKKRNVRVIIVSEYPEVQCFFRREVVAKQRWCCYYGIGTGYH